MVNISNDLECLRLPMNLQQVLIHPHYEVVLECPFDYLMQEIR